MSGAPPDRAFAFLPPPPDTASDTASPGASHGLAGLTVSAAGAVALVEGDAAVRQAILLLLSTMPGERVMRPDYGCDLWRLAFAPNDETTHGLAIHYVRRAIERFEPRVEIIAIDARADPIRADMIRVDLQYRARASMNEGRLSVPVALGPVELGEGAMRA